MVEQIRYDPTKLSSHVLGKALHYKHEDLRQAGTVGNYAEILVGRFLEGIEEVVATAYYGQKSRKPSREDILSYKRKVKSFRDVLTANIDYILNCIFERGSLHNGNGKSRLKFTPTVSFDPAYFPACLPEWPRIIRLTPEEIETNRKVFNLLMQQEIYFLSRNRRFEAAMLDYGEISLFRDGEIGFDVLERRCRNNLRDFARRHTTAEFDKDDLYQEGLLTVLGCVRLYQGRGFARFSSMVAAALRNKFIDLFKYSMADKRRINRKAERFSTQDECSRTKQRVDEATYRAWLVAQRQQDFLNDGYSPFRTLHPSDIFDPWYNTGTTLDARVGREEASEENFPYLGYGNVDTNSWTNGQPNWL